MRLVAGGAAIESHGLRKRYGDVVALDEVDLRVEAGSILGLLGPNGAGKTTAVRILTTLLAPDGGTARVAGFDVVKDAGKDPVTGKDRLAATAFASELKKLLGK